MPADPPPSAPDVGLIIVRPHGAGWEVWENETVRPVFERRRPAVEYAIKRGVDGRRRLEVRDAAGAAIRAIDGKALRELAEKQALE